MILDTKQYFGQFSEVLASFLADKTNVANLAQVVRVLKESKGSNRRIFLVGNGGSAAIAEHMAVDLTKNAGLCAQAFSGTPLLTTFANDYGYEKVFSQCVKVFASEGDILIAISSSGNSANIVATCEEARRKGMYCVTFTAFEKNNPVSQLGNINFWVDSKGFGFVEIIHNLLIHYINDAVIGSAEYMIKGWTENSG